MLFSNTLLSSFKVNAVRALSVKIVILNQFLMSSNQHFGINNGEQVAALHI